MNTNHTLTINIFHLIFFSVMFMAAFYHLLNVHPGILSCHTFSVTTLLFIKLQESAQHKPTSDC